MARYKSNDEYIKYIFNNTDNTFIKVVRGNVARGEEGTPVPETKSFSVEVEGAYESSPTTKEFLKSTAGKITTADIQLEETTLDANGEIKLGTSLEAKKILTHIWGDRNYNNATVQLTSTLLTVDSKYNKIEFI